MAAGALAGAFALRLWVLAMAGGLSEFAARGRIIVLRQGPTTTRQIPFPYDKLIANGLPGASR